VRLLAVSKTFPAEAVDAAAAAGQRLFGENRVQEAAEKIPRVANPGLEWHLIGHLQSNKARRAVELFDVVETVDSERIARSLDRCAAELGKVLPVLLEVNIGEEAQKSGVAVNDVVSLVHCVDNLPHLKLTGLMAIPPFDENPEASRPYFRRLAGLVREAESSLGRALPHLSMGMSHDFQAAVEEGATIVRVGTGVFGVRAL
jgi:pyridoxal phosphate enzyme (YggS family)